jgi:cyclin-dependent kinase
VFEYLDQDLKMHLDACDGGLDIVTLKSYLQQLLTGLAFCHQNFVLHRDLKPQNLLINSEGDLKLADFGLARAIGIHGQSYTHEVVTLWYRSPDVLMGSRNYSTPLDMWSVGCIFAEMVNGAPLFTGTSVDSQIDIMYRYLGTPIGDMGWTSDLPNFKRGPIYPTPPSLHSLVPNLDDNGIDLLQSMLRYDPDSNERTLHTIHSTHTTHTIHTILTIHLNTHSPLYTLYTLSPLYTICYVKV